MGFLAFVPFLEKILDKVIPDPQARAQLQLDLARLADAEAQRESAERLAQINVNNTEAANPNMFVAGWRPFIGWVCGAGAALNFVAMPLAGWVATVGFGYTGTLPAADMVNLMTLLGGMLGFGYLRSSDKKAGVEDTAIVTKKDLEKKKKKVLGVDWPF